MIKSNINITLTKNLTADLVKSLNELASKTICIGIPEESNVEESNNTNTKGKKDRITNAQKLYLNTHGVRDLDMRIEMQKDIDGGMEYNKAHELYMQEHGSPIYSVPPRPVLVPALDDGKDDIANLMRKATLEVLDGNNATLALGPVGMEGQNIARAWFDDPKNNWAPNAPATLRQKNSEKPLIDSSEMKNSIIYVIRGGDK